MNPDDFEKQLQRQPLRPLPAEWRAEILAAALDNPSPNPPERVSPLAALRSQIATILWPCPQAWAGLAAVWLLILVVNVATADKTETMAAKAAPPSPEFRLALRTQHQEFARLLQPLDELVAEPPKPAAPKPRGAAKPTFLYA